MRDWRGRTVRTMCGPIRLERPWYHCAGCGQGWSPADATLGLAPRARVLATREAAEPVDPAPGRLLVETDGVQVHFYGGWSEVKLGLVAGYVDQELVAPSYVATRAPVEAFGPRLLAEAARRGALDPALRRPGLAARRRAATTVAWSLLRPDSHRPVIASFQDAL